MRTQRPGHRVLERVITEPDLRFRATVDGYAHRYTLDRDDLYQAASERLLRQGNVEPDHEGLRGWLDRCVRYAALDMIKDRNRQPVAMSELPERATNTPQDSVGWEQWLTTLLAATLSPDQVRAVVELARDPDLDLRELAKLVDKSYAGARQLKSRAMAKLGRLIGLTAEETRRLPRLAPRRRRSRRSPPPRHRPRPSGTPPQSRHSETAPVLLPRRPPTPTLTAQPVKVNPPTYPPNPGASLRQPIGNRV